MFPIFSVEHFHMKKRKQEWLSTFLEPGSGVSCPGNRPAPFPSHETGMFPVMFPLQLFSERAIWRR